MHANVGVRPPPPSFNAAAAAAAHQMAAAMPLAPQYSAPPTGVAPPPHMMSVCPPSPSPVTGPPAHTHVRMSPPPVPTPAYETTGPYVPPPSHTSPFPGAPVSPPQMSMAHTSAANPSHLSFSHHGVMPPRVPAPSEAPFVDLTSDDSNPAHSSLRAPPGTSSMPPVFPPAPAAAQPPQSGSSPVAVPPNMDFIQPPPSPAPPSPSPVSQPPTTSSSSSAQKKRGRQRTVSVKPNGVISISSAKKRKSHRHSTGGTIPAGVKKPAPAPRLPAPITTRTTPIVAPRATRRPQRKRRRAAKYADDDADKEQGRQDLETVLEMSKIEARKSDLSDIPMCPSFYPTPEEFADPLGYIRKIRPKAEPHGICRIVPPAGWKRPASEEHMAACHERFPTRMQSVHQLQQGVGFESGGDYTIPEFRKKANDFLKAFISNYDAALGEDGVTTIPDAQKVAAEGGAAAAKSPPPKGEKTISDIFPSQKKQRTGGGGDSSSKSPVKSEAGRKDVGGDESAAAVKSESKKRVKGEKGADARQKYDELTRERQITEMEKSFWNMIDRNLECTVEYGNDIDRRKFRSGFSMDEPETPWNLNFLPRNPTSLLRHIDDNISGVTVPWVYFGMLFSAFCWHYEDDSLYSISYNHYGAEKIWYGVPGSHAEDLERVVQQSMPELFEREPDLMMKLVTMLNPALLVAAGVPVVKSYHAPGQYMVTFPRSFHCGFNAGFNCAEAVNFATENWLPYGLQCLDKYRRFKRESVISHHRITVLAAQSGHQNNETQFVSDAMLSLCHDEVSHRETAREFIGREEPMPEEGLAEHDLDPPLCGVCKSGCYLSLVRCKCSKRMVVCALHAGNLCRCPNESRVLRVRHSTKYLWSLASSIAEAGVKPES